MDKPSQRLATTFLRERKAGPRAKRDLLAERAAYAAALLGIVAAGLIVASIKAGVTGNLPTIAGGWKLGVELLRAAIAFAVIAVLLIVLVRGWGGHWPQRISTTGIDWGDLTEAIEERRQARDTVHEVEAELTQMLAALKGHE
jgi:uncharacterized membrane protein